jgi:hypothetical protein
MPKENMMKAFPRADGKYDSSQPDEKGMDLRDYFAAKAMQALIPITIKSIADELVTPQRVTESAYHWANLMLKAREEK